MAPAVIRRRRLYEEIADDLEQMIQDGRYAQADLLPCERDLMRQYGVGRPAVAPVYDIHVNPLAPSGPASHSGAVMIVVGPAV